MPSPVLARTHGRCQAERLGEREGIGVADPFGDLRQRISGRLKRGRGRPRKNPEPALEQDHYRVEYTCHDIPQEQSEERLREAATFVLIRTRSKGWDIDDDALIDRYKGQYYNEHGFAWLKSPAAND